jgi:hypothetical protein
MPIRILEQYAPAVSSAHKEQGARVMGMTRNEFAFAFVMVAALSFVFGGLL